MGLGNVLQSAGALTRSESEFNLLKTENQKRIRVNNTISVARMEEKDSRANELDDSQKTLLDKYYQAEAAEVAKQAAELGFYSSLVSLVGNFAAAATKPGGSIGGALVGSIGDAFGAAGAFMAMKGAWDEIEMLKTQLGDLTDTAKQDKQNVAALDGNPAL